SNGCLTPCSANYVPLSHISFLERAASVYSDRVSIIYGDTRYSWRQTHDRCLKLASAPMTLFYSAANVINRGTNRGIRMYLCTFVRQYNANRSKQLCDNVQVAAVAPNVPALYEQHFGVPMAGAVLCALNTRLDAAMLATLLEQLDHETSSTAERLPPGSLNYNRLLDLKRADFQIVRPEDECNPISVNYTSGSTGKPKGVVYSHRVAYLNSIVGIFRYDMNKKTVFLWTVDMFRCNGWCLTWAMAALGGTNICTRHVTAKAIFKAISLHKVTHFCGAPALLNLISEAPFEDQLQLDHKVKLIVAGALMCIVKFDLGGRGDGGVVSDADVEGKSGPEASGSLASAGVGVGKDVVVSGNRSMEHAGISSEDVLLCVSREDTCTKNVSSQKTAVSIASPQKDSGREAERNDVFVVSTMCLPMSAFMVSAPMRQSKASKRQKRNYIAGLEDKNGVWRKKWKELE
ncbi:hypothetical protein RJ640_027830, partial [Escallonia rubra]